MGVSKILPIQLVRVISNTVICAKWPKIGKFVKTYEFSESTKARNHVIVIVRNFQMPLSFSEKLSVPMKQIKMKIS